MQLSRGKPEKLLYEAARRYVETHDPAIKSAIDKLSLQLADQRQLAVLVDAVARCRNEDMRTREVDTALSFLEDRTRATRAFEQFRSALDKENEEDRCQALVTALDEIRFVLETNSYHALPM
jgi:hypothetical protein